MRNAQTLRQWQIVRHCGVNRWSTIESLSRLTERSTKTIRRDIKALREAGFPIEAKKLDEFMPHYLRVAGYWINMQPPPLDGRLPGFGRHRIFQRQWHILHLLKRGTETNELANILRCTTKTIRRDLDALTEAGFPVDRERENNKSTVLLNRDWTERHVAIIPDHTATDRIFA
jgi:predicted DNA-binding transcriptional regulator YafY